MSLNKKTVLKFLLMTQIIIYTSLSAFAKSTAEQIGGGFLDFNKGSTLQLLGDVCILTLPLMSYALNLQKEPNNKGLMQNLKSQASALALTVALKQATNESSFLGYKIGKRPNGDGFNFPSGHTALVFATSLHVSKRYEQYFWPFMMFSCFTAFTRVYTKKHDVPAVLGGAILGWTSSSYFTTKFGKKSKFLTFYSPERKSWQFGFSYSF